MTTDISSRKHPVPPDRYTAYIERILAEAGRQKRRERTIRRWVLGVLLVLSAIGAAWENLP